MRVMNLFRDKAKDMNGCQPVTIAFLGDSVTQGCFEVFIKNDGEVETVYDVNCAYHSYLQNILATLYPNVTVNIINAGISGNTAEQGYARIERDVLRFHPDLVVVCFGLNDCGQGKDYINVYAESLGKIFESLKNEGTEIIFMTPNMMNTEVSCHITDERIRDIAVTTLENQTGGLLDSYLQKAREVCESYQIPVCDCYKDWKTLEKYGVDITERLANDINHPDRKMNWLFAVRLFEMMIAD